MRTVGEAFEASEVRVEPASEPGIRVNGVPANGEHVQKADVRVDLFGAGGRSFVVEHVLAPLGLTGVTAAEVVGTRDDWSFARPEHRFAYSRGGGPNRVVGHPAGYPNPAIAKGVRAVGVEELDEPVRRSVAEPVSVERDGGALTLRPSEPRTGIRFEIEFRGEALVATVDPAGETDPELVTAVVNSQTPFLTDSPTEGITHAVADLVSDIAVIGGFSDLVVEAELNEAYHALTVGAARRAHERDVVVTR